MKCKFLSRTLSLFLAFVLCIGMLPISTLATEGHLTVSSDVSSADAEETMPVEKLLEEESAVSTAEVGTWKIQDWGKNEDVPVQEGWLTAATAGGFTLDYTKVIEDRAKEGLVIFDSNVLETASYRDSTLELDIKVTRDSSIEGDKNFNVAVLPRFQSGKDCAGLAIHAQGRLQRAEQKNGSEDWAWLNNANSLAFEYDNTYHLKFVTEETTITVFAAKSGDEPLELVTCSINSGIVAGGYGFRIWGSAKTVEVTNVVRTEIAQRSSLGKSEVRIPFADWGKGTTIPVSFVDGDSVASIRDGETQLSAGSDYSIVDSIITITPDFMKRHQDKNEIILMVTFTKGGTGTFKMIREPEAGGAGRWKIQKYNTDVDVEILDDWITPAATGVGFTINYTNVIEDIGEGIVIYDSEAKPYLNSTLEFDLKMTDDKQDGWIAVAPFGRFVDGKNCEGFAITRDTGLQSQGRKDGSEIYPGVDNVSGLKFVFDKTYHIKMETIGNKITVYAAEGEGELETLTSFESPLGIGASTYGFRMWRGGKTMSIQNIERTEIVTSSLEKGMEQIPAAEWGKADVTAPVSFGTDDAIQSVKNGDATLAPDTDYSVDTELNTFTLKKEYIAKQAGNLCLQVAFAKGSVDTLWVMKYDPNSQQEYIWTPDQGIDMWTSMGGNGTFAMAEDGSGMHVTGRNILVNELAPIAVNGEIEFTFEFLSDNWQRDQKNHGIGSLFRVDQATESWQALAVDGYVSSIPRWSFINSDKAKAEVTLDGDTLLSRNGVKDYVIKHRFEQDALALWMDNQFAHSAGVKQVETVPGGMGLMFNGDLGDVLVKKVVFRELAPLKQAEGERMTTTIAKDGLTVQLDQDFPRVVDYTLNSKKMHGSELRYNYVTINSVDIPATAEITAQTENSITYAVTPDATKSGVTFDVKFTVLDDQILDMHIINIVEPKDEQLNSIALTDQPLISANSTEEGATLDASWLYKPVDNWGIRDIHETISERKISTTADFGVTIPIITNGVLSASMYNNVFLDGDEFVYRAFNLPNGEVTAGFWNNQFLYRGLDDKKIRPFPSEPDENDLYCRIAIAEDTNGDDIMNWQDGANAAKKLTNGTIPGGDQAARSFFHVGYNFASGAQQPFLKVADNMKRLSNSMDGFGQQLIFKGYGNEGHDSGHADYQDINRRAGGAEGMNIAIEEADKINSNFGIHLNNQEAYPEAKMFNDDSVANMNGWAWMDQSKYIRRDYDMLNTDKNGFNGRLDQLFEQTPDLDLVYVDCWQGDRWNELNFIGTMMKNGAELFANENSPDFNRFGVWVHSTAGNNSEGIHQFVYNNQKDIYKGSDIYWGGYGRGGSMMSWQHNNNINGMIEQFYTNQLPQKYLMCHEVLKVADGVGTFSDNITSSKKIITKDGNKITDGDGKIFIPWYAEDSETKNPDEAAKIYHWNRDGGETTWTLPLSWQQKSLTTVKLYKNTQAGRVFVKDINVVENKVTINADSKTPYVVYPGEAAAQTTVWSVNSPIKDTGFNSRNFSIWQKSGDANIQYNDDGNGVSILTMDGVAAGRVSQTMAGLEIGQKYRVLVFAGAENGKTARITVETPDGKTCENYLEQVKMNNQYFDNYAKNKPVQLMWVDFVATAETADLTLSADACTAGNGKATFMETRIVKTAEPDLPEGYVAKETFEFVEQGAYGIFNPESSADGVPHLSETHRPYTGNDTISGDWSLKLFGHYGQGEPSIRTSPATMRLTPNTEYTMEFDTVGGGKVFIQSEADGTDKCLEQDFSAGHSKFTFTTGTKTDYIVRIERGRVLDDFQVYVEAEVEHVTGVTMSKSAMTLKPGDTETLTAVITPENASNKAINWNTDNSEVAVVNQDGVVTAVGNGTTNITVTTVDGSFTAVCEVTVKTETEPPINPPSDGGGSTSKPPVATENPDGSKTTTVTDKKTGSVTETTTYPDGTKIVATTPKGGNTSIEVTVPKDKEKATVTIPTAEQPKPGEVAVIIHEDGTREVIKTSVSTKDGLRVTLTGNAKLEIVDNSKSFADVPADHWGVDAIAFVTSRELFNGGDGGFQPTGDMSRAMLFTVLARLDGQDLTGGETWYENAMLWAKESGVSDGTNPDAGITRESLAVMLYRYAGSPEVGGMALGEFTDVEGVSAWASDAMLWCVESGILNGSGGKLNPADTASRAEVAAMLQRFVELGRK